MKDCMTQFSGNSHFSHHVDGIYLPHSQSFYVRVSSQLEDGEKLKQAEFTITGPELDTLIVKLQNLRSSVPAPLPVEPYGWLAA